MENIYENMHIFSCNVCSLSVRNVSDVSIFYAYRRGNCIGISYQVYKNDITCNIVFDDDSDVEGYFRSNYRKNNRSNSDIGILHELFVYLYISFGKVKLAIQYTDNPEERNWIEGMKNAYGVPNESSYCVLIPKSDSGYAYFLEKYIFQSNSVGSAVISTQEDMDNITAKYVFLYDQNNEIVNAWVKNHYPDQYGNDVIIQGEK